MEVGADDLSQTREYDEKEKSSKDEIASYKLSSNESKIYYYFDTVLVSPCLVGVKNRAIDFVRIIIIFSKTVHQTGGGGAKWSHCIANKVIIFLNKSVHVTFVNGTKSNQIVLKVLKSINEII